MKFSTVVVPLAGLVASAVAQSNSDGGTMYTTEVVTAYTTYCPVRESSLLRTASYINSGKCTDMLARFPPPSPTGT